MSLKIGYVGLGALGTPMAINLAKHAFANSFPPLTIWNRSKDRYAVVKEEVSDVTEAGEVEEAAQNCDVMFTCLLNETVADELYGRMLRATKGRKVIFVDQTTLSPKTSGVSRAH